MYNPDPENLALGEMMAYSDPITNDNYICTDGDDDDDDSVMDTEDDDDDDSSDDDTDEDDSEE